MSKTVFTIPVTFDTAEDNVRWWKERLEMAKGPMRQPTNKELAQQNICNVKMRRRWKHV